MFAKHSCFKAFSHLLLVEREKVCSSMELELHTLVSRDTCVPLDPPTRSLKVVIAAETILCFS